MTPEERFDRIERSLEKNTADISDLIVVSRTINMLIDTVDRIIRQLGKNGTKQ